MKKQDILLHGLDLSYKRNLQLLTVVLLIGGGSIVTSFIGFLLYSDKTFEYALILAVTSIFTYLFYHNIDENLKEISSQIQSLPKK